MLSSHTQAGLPLTQGLKDSRIQANEKQTFGLVVHRGGTKPATFCSEVDHSWRSMTQMRLWKVHCWTEEFNIGNQDQTEQIRNIFNFSQLKFVNFCSFSVWERTRVSALENDQFLLNTLLKSVWKLESRQRERQLSVHPRPMLSPASLMWLCSMHTPPPPPYLCHVICLAPPLSLVWHLVDGKWIWNECELLHRPHSRRVNKQETDLPFHFRTNLVCLNL